jgi:hypothetical protein
VANFFLTIKTFRPGVVAHVSNPSYSGSEDLMDHGSGENVSETLISTNKPDVVACACQPSYSGGVSRRSMV